VKVGVVKEFRGEYFFLSNYYTAPAFDWRGHMFFSGEQAFAYAKTLYPRHGESMRAKDLGKRLLDTGNPGVAKKYGREVPLDVPTWDAQRVPIMREIVHAKFRGVPGLAGQLVNTGAMMLVEGNTWGDTFWGRCNGKGFNTLGAILMEERGVWSRGSREAMS
jgi:ribA/ribD-fused uncharacterized protein